MTPYTGNFCNLTCVFKILVKFDIYFLGLPWEIVFGVYVKDNLLCLQPLKNEKKECHIVEIILVQGFCPLKIEIIQFPDGFHLNIIKHVFYYWDRQNSSTS